MFANLSARERSFVPMALLSGGHWVIANTLFTPAPKVDQSFYLSIFANLSEVVIPLQKNLSFLVTHF